MERVFSASRWWDSWEFQRDVQYTKGSEIRAWWEARRLYYNSVVGVSGFVTLILCLLSAIVGSAAGNQNIEFPDPPVFVFAGIVFYGFMANICYTLGWVAETIAMWTWGSEQSGCFGRIAFALGVLFSVALTLAPGMLLFLWSLMYAVLHRQ